MEKQEFFDNLHKQLAEKYSTDTHVIGLIRTLGRFCKYDRLESMDWCDIKNKKYYYMIKKNPKYKLQELTNTERTFNLLENISDESWEDIIHKTEFDTR